MESKFKQLSDRNWLYDKYINNKLSSKKIGELLTCSDATLLNFYIHNINKGYQNEYK